MAPSVEAAHTQTRSCTHWNRTAPVWCQQVTRWSICFAPLPSRMPARCAHRSLAQFSTHSLAGRRRDSLACWRSNANRRSLLSCCSAATLPLKRSLSVSSPDQETNPVLPTFRHASRTVMHFTVSQHSGQHFTGRGLFFVTVRGLCRRDRGRQLSWGQRRMRFTVRIVGNSLSQKKQSCPPQTSRCNFIIVGWIERESQPRLCRRAHICRHNFH